MTWKCEPFDLVWRVKTRLPERYGAACRVLARGKHSQGKRWNSRLVEFESDGLLVVTSGNYLRKRKD